MSDNSGVLVRDELWFDAGWTMIPNTWARDTRLTNQARGLLVQLASHDVGFEITVAMLSAHAMNGRDAIRNQVGELERAGYLKRYRRRVKNRIAGIEWRLRDPHAPVDKRDTPLEGFPELPPLGTQNPRSEQAPENQAPENQSPENQSPENQSPENPTTIEDQLKEHLTNVPETTTEQPVDNSPAQPRDQGENDASGGSHRPADASPPFDLVGSLDRARAAYRPLHCPGRRAGQPHQYNATSLRCEHCGNRPPDYDPALDARIDTTTGEVV